MADNNDIADSSLGIDLLYDVNQRVGSSSRLSEMVQEIVKMTQYNLKASASSVLLYDEKKQELFFEVIEGEVRDHLKQVRFSADKGLAGWVVQNCKPEICNEIQQDKRFNGQIDSTTGFSTRNIMCVPLVVHQKTLGVLEVLNKLDGSDFNQQDLDTLLAVTPIAAMATENTILHQAVVDGYKQTIKSLAATIDAKDSYTHGHSQRVMEYALIVGAALGLPSEQLEIIEYAGLLHDIGKIGIPDIILCKPTSLTAQEWKMIRGHPLIGAEITKDIPFLEEARNLVLSHHERYDGGGYPRGLTGENIPLGARILAVADTFDTMTTDRAYRKALSVDEAIDELQRCSGTQLCPEVVRAFVAKIMCESEFTLTRSLDVNTDYTELITA